MRAIAGSDPIAVGEIGVPLKGIVSSNASASRAVEPADEALARNPAAHRRR